MGRGRRGGEDNSPANEPRPSKGWPSGNTYDALNITGTYIHTYVCTYTIRSSSVHYGVRRDNPTLPERRQRQSLGSASSSTHFSSLPGAQMTQFRQHAILSSCASARLITVRTGPEPRKLSKPRRG